MVDASPSAVDVLPPLVVDSPRIAPTLARRIRLVGLDVDGVLTDGGVYLGAATSGGINVPFELKRYDIQDGLGIQMLRDCGVKVVIITGRVSDSVAQRARELRVDAVVQDPEARKLTALTKIVSDFGCTLDEVAFVGDDLPDLSVLRRVGLPVAVGNAVAEVRRVAQLQLHAPGGHGAVREFAEALLLARGEWTDAVERYVASRSVPAATPDDAREDALP
ncbi:KdsC family phosphatase [Gemmatimonas groenlandica]|uniref:3-deoxy-D-manno-octulosonate 8-phosphate phosphatase KdsC n=1 Tax=Gemmatimonas groenlandica TaxID=2732249 RepID=A0A6M4IMS6_9BACT|nr:HAD hydrolase family protein [Gemmatimonas groenlandica]QJR35079.1 HAD hydrolase family protein [Gemmatimonas groenlandica]